MSRIARPGDPRLLRPFEVVRLVGLARRTLLLWAQAGHFPRPVESRSGGHRRWLEAEVHDWLAARDRGECVAPSRRTARVRLDALERTVADLRSRVERLESRS